MPLNLKLYFLNNYGNYYYYAEDYPSALAIFLRLKKLLEHPFEFDAIVGRGGLLKPIPGGVYEVNDAMLDDITHAMRSHFTGVLGFFPSAIYKIINSFSSCQSTDFF